MQLTRFTDYSLRILTYLAVHSDGLVRMDDITSVFGISKGHVMKAVRRLVGLELVESVRGRGGGLRLARPPSRIVVGDVVRATEERLAPAECFSKRSVCPIEPACRLRSALREAQDAFFTVLDGYSLEDLVASNRKLARLLASHGSAR